MKSILYVWHRVKINHKLFHKTSYEVKKTYFVFHFCLLNTIFFNLKAKISHHFNHRQPSRSSLTCLSFLSSDLLPSGLNYFVIQRFTGFHLEVVIKMYLFFLDLQIFFLFYTPIVTCVKIKFVILLNI